MKRIGIIGAAVVLAAAAAAFYFIGNSRYKELTIVFPAMNQSQKNFIGPLVTAFELDTGYVVKYSFRDASAVYGELMEKRAAAPLYYLIDNYRLTQLESEGCLEKIDPVKNEEVDALFKKDRYFQPVSWYPWGVFYNRDLFGMLGFKVPADWKELLSLAARAGDGGYPAFSLMKKIKWPSAVLFDYVDLVLNGREFHDNLLHGKIPFTDERVRQVFSRIVALYRGKQIYLDGESTDWTSMIRAVADGKALMHVSGSFYFESADPVQKARLGWFPFPGSSTLVASSSGFVIPSGTKNKRGAEKFLKFVLSSKGQGIMERNSALIPVNGKAADDLKRPDLDSAFKSLDDFDSLIPSFERNCHDKLAVPLKNAITSLSPSSDDLFIDRTLTALENVRQSFAGK